MKRHLPRASAFAQHWITLHYPRPLLPMPSTASYFATQRPLHFPSIGPHFANQGPLAMCGSNTSGGDEIGPGVLPPKIGMRETLREAKASPPEVLPLRAGRLRWPLLLFCIGPYFMIQGLQLDRTSLCKGICPSLTLDHTSISKVLCPCLPLVRTSLALLYTLLEHRTVPPCNPASRPLLDIQLRHHTTPPLHPTSTLHSPSSTSYFSIAPPSHFTSTSLFLRTPRQHHSVLPSNPFPT